MKIYVVGGNINYTNFVENVTLVDNVEDAEVVFFTGGEDVSPSLYGCEKHPLTFNNSLRDKREVKVFNKIDPKKQVCVGICRGSQFLCVMNGGLLVQHCEGHAIGSTHAITNGEMIYQITSTHHQMQYPYNLPKKDFTILYKSEYYLSGTYEGDKIDSKHIHTWGEPEIVLYHKEGLPKCLAIQGHPEMMPLSSVAKMINKLIHDLL